MITPYVPPVFKYKLSFNRQIAPNSVAWFDHEHVGESYGSDVLHLFKVKRARVIVAIEKEQGKVCALNC